MTTILGISAFYHDSAATLVADGNILAAAQEERFTRIKHDAQYPYNAVKYVLEEANLKLSEIDHIVFFEKPFLKFERLLETYLDNAPHGLKSFNNLLNFIIKGPGEKIICASSGNKNFKLPYCDAPIIFIFGLPSFVPAISCTTYTIGFEPDFISL